MDLGQLFSGMDEIEIMVLFPEELEHPLLDLPGKPVVRCLAPGPVAYAFIALFPYPFDHSPHLPIAEADKSRCRCLSDFLFYRLMDYVKPFCFLSAHGDHVLFRHNAPLLRQDIVT
jgi:hypothetical protein